MRIRKFLCSAVILLIVFAAAASPAVAQKKSQNQNLKKLIETLRQRIEHLETQTTTNYQNLNVLKNDLKGNTTLINSNYIEFNTLRNSVEQNFHNFNTTLLDNKRRIKLSSMKNAQLSSDFLKDRFRKLNITITKGDIGDLLTELGPGDYCDLYAQFEDLSSDNNEEEDLSNILFAAVDECQATVVSGVQNDDVNLADEEFDIITAMLNTIFNFLKSLTIDSQ